MKLNKSALRHLALGFFVSGVLLSGYGLLFADESLSAEEQTYKEKYEDLVAAGESSGDSVAEQPTEEADSTSDTSAEIDSSEESASNTDTSSETDETAQEEATDPLTTQVVIESGDPVSFASNQLQSQGIIESASDFNDFLEENDYTGRLRPGTYEVNSDMTFEEIAVTLMTEN